MPIIQIYFNYNKLIHEHSICRPYFNNNIGLYISLISVYSNNSLDLSDYIMHVYFKYTISSFYCIFILYFVFMSAA